MRLNRVLPFAFITVLAVGLPAAQADLVITPFAGAAFGGDARAVPSDDDRRASYGLGLAVMAPIGFEVDFAYAPDFFGSGPVPQNNLATLMGNLVVSGGISDSARIYASGGGGLLRSHVGDADDFFEVDRNDFAANVGAGVLVNVSEHLGLRGDVRYFRNLGDSDPDADLDIDFGTFDFWRGTVGLSLVF